MRIFWHNHLAAKNGASFYGIRAGWRIMIAAQVAGPTVFKKRMLPLLKVGF